MLIHAFFLFPETAGKTLEDTAKMFEDPNGLPYIGTVSTEPFVTRRVPLLISPQRPWTTRVEYNLASARETGDVPTGKLGSMDDGVHNEKAGEV